ncbi:hypothetical protein GCM10009825_25810 [Arthrobacter humicola]|uniref:Gram-positive cocci surface proteins LPxTG domain-containing protein n=2 Tax=Arthrobacter humicola TaxID=409291 RepID=A0ABN2ZA27_9MICC
MTLSEFNAAGALARRAADAAPSLRALPGYVGISLHAGTIVVEGEGPELRARVAELNRVDQVNGVDQLNQAGPADFVLAAPASAAVVPSAAELLASSTQQLFEAYVRDVGAAGLQAVTYTNGHFVIRTGGTTTAQTGPASSAGLLTGTDTTPATAPGTKPKMSAADFVARYANVALEQGSRIATEEDYFGGEGYIIDGRTVCSAGFGAFGPAGEPLILTAGHCAADGAAKQAEIENPAGAPAAGGAGSGTAAGTLGSFGFSQFGGPGNTKVASDGTNVGTDIAVLQGIRSGLDLQPAVTRWDNPADPGPTSVKIVGTVAPFQGQPVCRSGRSLGWSCGTVDSVGTWVIAGPDSLPPDYDNDLRALNGFDSTTVKSRPGDSGGPWISGNFAVGTHTGAESDGGVQTRAIATTLEDATGRIPGGVQLQLFLNKPTLAAAANGTLTAGEPITGHVDAAPASVVAPNSKVRITVQSSNPGQKPGQPLEVPVDASGNWQFPAPEWAGSFTFSAETVNGFSRSGAVSLSVKVSGLAAPVITAPADARTDGHADGPGLTAVETIEGTGEPGRTVRLSGDFTGTGLVAPDGRWSINVADQPVFGKVSVTAVLTAPGQTDSPSATSSFTVIPPVPAVSGIRDGKHLRQDSLPASISGTAVDGAEVSVSMDGAAIGSAQASSAGTGARASLQPRVPQDLAGGARWSVPFPAGLAAGAHRLTVTQAIDGVASLPAAVAFTIDAAPASAGTPDETPAVPQQPAVQQPAPRQPGTPAHSTVPAQVPVAQVPVAPSTVPPSTVPPSDASVTVGGTPPGNANQLAGTGAGGLLYAAGLGAGALLLGAAVVIFARRRAVR